MVSLVKVLKKISIYLFAKTTTHIIFMFWYFNINYVDILKEDHVFVYCLRINLKKSLDTSLFL